MTHPVDKRPIVMAATDLGEWGDLAVREADRWARAHDARLAVVHCVPIHAPISPLLPGVADDQLRDLGALEVRAGDALAARVGALTGREPNEYLRLVEAGTPYVEIVRAAEEHGAALVVVGARGAMGLMRALAGHTAEKVARYAHCPVLVARPTPITGRVLVATDLSDNAAIAVRKAAEVARSRGATLTAMHVVDTALPFPLEGGAAAVGYISAETLRADALVALRKHLADQRVEAHARVGDGLVPEAMAAAARDLPADLVVVGTVGRTGLARVTLGNTAELVIRDMPCSVLVVRAGA